MSWMTLLFWEWHLIERRHLRSIFAWFLEQLLKDLVSCGSPGECSMIDHFLGDAFGVLSFPFWSTVLQCGARLPIHTLTTGPCSQCLSGARFLTGGVFECDIAHRRLIAVLCLLYKIRCNPMHPLNDALPGPYVPVWLHAVPLLHIGILMRCLAAEPRSTAGLLFPTQCPSGTILLTAYSMVWDCRVSRARPMFFYWPKLLYPYYGLLLFFPFSSSCL